MRTDKKWGTSRWRRLRYLKELDKIGLITARESEEKALLEQSNG